MSWRQLTLFNCSGPFSKWSRVEHATPTSSLNVEAADVATAATVSHVQSVHADTSDLSDDSSVLTTYDLAMQPLIPRCSTPIFIDSNFDEASFSATFSPCKDPSRSNDNSQQSQHLTTSMANTCRYTPGSTEISFSYTSIYVTGCGKTSIVHTSNCSTLMTHKIYLKWMDRCETFRDCSTTIPVSSLKLSYLYTIPCGFYDSPNEQNWMCELCTFSQIRSHILYLLLHLSCALHILHAAY